MSLKEYIKKRDFKDTPEPKGDEKTNRENKNLEFVVQEHHASRLHYDFRLELEGVLISWAVPKGPSLDPKGKRLAIKVEDHPFEYRTFEGEIPKGNYGAGQVKIWDKGTYQYAEDVKDQIKSIKHGIKKGHLTFELFGDRLKGEFSLIKSKPMGEDAWLLIKKDDNYSVTGHVAEQLIDSKKSIEDLIKKGEKKKMPQKVKPMLATLVEESFDDPDWFFEIKWDGYRAIATKADSGIELYSRNQNDFSKKFPPVIEAMKSLKHNVVLDGEITALDEKGRANFGWLQNYPEEKAGTLVYCVFDILWCDGYDLQELNLVDRRRILKHVLSDHPGFLFSDDVDCSGSDLFDLAVNENFEGIMAKAKDSRYIQNKRSQNWLKIKTLKHQEAIIVGYSEPKGSRKHIGSLILAVNDGEKLKHVGNVGTGINPQDAKLLLDDLEKIRTKKSPLEEDIHVNNKHHWVEPKYICEVKYSEWTKSGHLRHPVFVGLRNDLNTKFIKKEIPRPLSEIQPERKINLNDAKIEFTNLAKTYFPEKGYTKGDLIEYYSLVGPMMLKYLKDRPHSLLRHPSGYRGSSFFQKDMDSKAPKWSKTIKVYSESSDKEIEYFVVDDVDSILYMAQLGCIEINPWNSTIKDLEKPSWVVIDLDPVDIDFVEVVNVANSVHELLEELRIDSYIKTSGKRGLHIYIPLGAKYDYDHARVFSELIARISHMRMPKTTSVERSPKKRQNKVYLDFLQNRRGQTLAAPYSVRPTLQASVATPLLWDEVNADLDPKTFTIENTMARIEEKGDLFKKVLKGGVDIEKTIAKMEKYLKD